MSAPFPWQSVPWERLCRAHRTGRLGHAVLLVGRRGIGKTGCAREFARLTLCEQAVAERACGSCRSCLLFDAGNHPDFRHLAPEEPGKSLGIDAVRELKEYFALTRHFAGAKIALLAPADHLTTEAANALLKILEEPPSSALLMLTASRLERLPATVRSRCHRLSLDGFDDEIARRWLAQRLPEDKAAYLDDLLLLTSGAPLLAAELACGPEADLGRRFVAALAAIQRGDTDGVAAAQDFAGADLHLLLDTAARVVHRVLLDKYGCAPAEIPGRRGLDHLHGLGNQLDFNHLFRFLDLLFETRRMLLGRGGVRDIDLVETVMMGWSTMGDAGNNREAWTWL